MTFLVNFLAFFSFFLMFGAGLSFFNWVAKRDGSDGFTRIVTAPQRFVLGLIGRDPKPIALCVTSFALFFIIGFSVIAIAPAFI